MCEVRGHLGHCLSLPLRSLAVRPLLSPLLRPAGHPDAPLHLWLPIWTDLCSFCPVSSPLYSAGSEQLETNHPKGEKL